MPDREKVIKGLEHCTKDGCRDCPYEKNCDVFDNAFSGTLVKDALELLKEQEPVKPVKTWDTYLCGNCNRNVYHEERDGCLVLYEERYTYCPNCGKRLDWNAGQG